MAIAIFCDINDTIKPENGKISTFSTETLREFKEKGELVLVTGKNRQKTEEFALVYGGSRYIITSNGGEVFDTLTRKVIYSAPIPKKSILELYKITRECDIRFILNADADFRFTTKIKYTDGSEKLIDDGNIDKIINKYKIVGCVLSDIPDKLISTLKQKAFELEGVVIGNLGVSKGNNYIDFISEFANKGIAIKKLIQHLGLDFKNTISIGNERNDISMFSSTFKSIAVANACEEIKKMVDEVIDSVDNDGVAKYIIKNFLDSKI